MAELDEAVREEVSAWGEVRPPYAVFPGVDPFDIGWRMGAGEWHIMVWSHWWSAGAPTEASRLAYFRRHPPPAGWLAWAATAVWPGPDHDPSEDDDDQAVRRLEAQGIGSHAAWRAWCSEAGE